MIDVLYLAAGAVAGSFARMRIGLWISSLQSDPTAFPWGTFLINVSGSLLLGFLMRYLLVVPSSRGMRIMLTTGFCGAYTTFSTFSYEALMLLREGQLGGAALYVVGSVVVSIIFCLIGYVLAGLAS